MQTQEAYQAIGSLKISKEVIATIARSAAMEIEGVASLASFTTNLKGWLFQRQAARPIGVNLTDDIAMIELHVNLKAGVKIPEVSRKMQAAVKEAVQNMTGIAVSRVNVTIAGIVFEEAAQLVPTQTGEME